MYRIILYLVLIGAVQSADGQFIQNSDFVCFSDADQSLQVIIPPATKHDEYVKKMNELLNRKMRGWISAIEAKQRMSKPEIDVLKKMVIKVVKGTNSIGSCKGDTILIDEGNLLVAYNICYAMAIFDAKRVSLNQYNYWHDAALFDAIIGGEPITYIKGVDDFANFIFSNGGLDTGLQQSFQSKLYGWLALFVFHEASHRLLHHGQIMKNTFPGISGVISAWTEEQLQFCRKQELEADNKALEIYMMDAGFDFAGTGDAILQWWLVRELYFTHNNIKTYKTHPGVRERSYNLITKLCAYKEIDCSGVLPLLDTLIDGYLAKSIPFISVPDPVADSLENLEFERFRVRNDKLRLGIK